MMNFIYFWTYKDDLSYPNGVPSFPKGLPFFPKEVPGFLEEETLFLFSEIEHSGKIFPLLYPF